MTNSSFYPDRPEWADRLLPLRFRADSGFEELKDQLPLLTLPRKCVHAVSQLTQGARRSSTPWQAEVSIPRLPTTSRSSSTCCSTASRSRAARPAQRPPSSPTPPSTRCSPARFLRRGSPPSPRCSSSSSAPRPLPLARQTGRRACPCTRPRTGGGAGAMAGSRGVWGGAARRGRSTGSTRSLGLP
jgi:hypothetical protein